VGRDRKAQLGARVPDVVRQMAVEQAAARGVSLNQHIEWLIRQAASEITMPTPPGLGDGLRMLEDAAEEAGATEEEVAEILTGIGLPKKLDVNCSLRDYHWRCSPGNPCRRCGGEA
jgi:hypothetical protein